MVRLLPGVKLIMVNIFVAKKVGSPLGVKMSGNPMFQQGQFIIVSNEKSRRLCIDIDKCNIVSYQLCNSMTGTLHQLLHVSSITFNDFDSFL